MKKVIIFLLLSLSYLFFSCSKPSNEQGHSENPPKVLKSFAVNDFINSAFSITCTSSITFDTSAAIEEECIFGIVYSTEDKGDKLTIENGISVESKSYYQGPADPNEVHVRYVIERLAPNAKYYLRPFVKYKAGDVVYGEISNTLTESLDYGCSISIDNITMTQADVHITTELQTEDGLDFNPTVCVELKDKNNECIRKYTAIKENGTNYVSHLDQLIPYEHYRISISIAESTRGYSDKVFTTLLDLKPLVDLGLSVKWMPVNLGADSPEKGGLRCTWADTKAYDYGYETGLIEEEDYKWFGDPEYTKYNSTDQLTRMELCDDAANYMYGGKVRIPTVAEFKELVNFCTIIEEEYNGIMGLLFRSKLNNNAIFIPDCFGSLAGYNLACMVSLWTSDIFTTTIDGRGGHAAYLFNYDWHDEVNYTNGNRFFTEQVRAVSE